MMKTIFPIIVLLIGVLVSCDTSIDPLDRETGIYAIYGALDMNDTTNYIRVRDLNSPFTLAATDTLDATVILENDSNGITTTLNGIQKEFDGVFLYNFPVNLEVLPNTNYTLTATRSDGTVVSASVLTPTRPDIIAMPVNDNCYQPITVEFEPTNGGTIVYNIGFDISGTTFFKSPEILRENQNSPEKMSFTFTPIVELRTLNFAGEEASCFKLDTNTIKVFYTYYSEGLYEFEKVPNSQNPLDIFESTKKLGAYFEIPTWFSIPIDTSKVCPQDC